MSVSLSQSCDELLCPSTAPTATMPAALTQASRGGAKRPWIQSAGNVSRNKPFLALKQVSQGFYHSDGRAG